MGEIRVSEIGTMAVRTERRFVAEVVACGVAVGLASLAFSVLRQDAPAPLATSTAPMVDAVTGKIVDRFGPTAVAEIVLERRTVNSVALFAPGLDLGPGLTAIVAHAERAATEARPTQVAEAAASRPPSVAAKARTAPSRPVMVGKAAPVGETAPLPPPRPEALVAETLAMATTDESVAKQSTGLFGWSLPGELVPTGRKVLRHVASLGDTVLDQRKVLKEVVSMGDAVLDRLTP